MAIEKQKLILISGIVLGVVAVVMVKVYLDQQRQVIQEQAKKAVANIQANQTSVLMARRDIPAGSVIESGMLNTAIVPNKFVQPQAATSLDRISGMVSVAEISKGEQVTLSKLTSAKKAGAGGGGDLAGMTPAGKRAIPISVDNLAALAGMVRPGDYVDVIAMLQVPVQGPEGQQTSQVAVLPLFQNVLVLAIGQNTGGPVAQGGGRYSKTESAPGNAGIVTLALSPQEASFVAFVQEQGKLRLTLRSPADAKVEQIVPANWNTLFQYIMPQSPLSGEGEMKKEEQPEGTVEIYRGLNKEKIPLSR